MNLFQFLFVGLAALLFFMSLLAAHRGWSTRREGLASAVVWFVAGCAILWPDATTRIAQFFGLGRGANLLLYATALAMLVGFSMVYIRLRHLRRELTMLVRHLAIVEADRGQSALGASEQGDKSDQ